jgi:serine/threonine protein kinase/tetratricopeptide (TPR) repeat protein
MAAWNPKANEIFLQALEVRPPEGRRRLIRDAAGGDAELQAQVESLIDASDRAGSYLESPAAGVGFGEVLAAGGPSPHEDAAVREGPGTVVRRYKLLEQIGEGGMGVVFLAEQTRPVHRQVALKIVKAGMDTRQVVARFEAERQALAMMDHPNIAKVLDAGATEGGRPFFVMELVKGVSVTKYCDERRLTPGDRLLLFVQVCAAVQHAHQKGIIHRDLKPSNVLVASYDGRPVPKVIDFGVAKATGARLTERTLFTGFGAMVGTLEYMSPEQADLNQLDVDTRSDIYSLGVLLYELLTGTTPLEGKRLKEAALVEALRAIREEEPVRPSTRLSMTGGMPAIALNRGVDPGRLNALVRGDLDWIVMKCLEKDRARRYDTASGLARDIERFLDDEPVQARPPTTAYRLQKFVRRHRPALVTSAVLGLFLLVSTGVAAAAIGWAARDRAARRAVVEREAAKALEEAEHWCGRDNLPEALAATRRVEALLAGGGAGEALRGRVRQWRADVDMASRLEEIRLGQSEVKVEYFDHTAAGPEYAEAFKAYGIGLTVVDPAEAASRVRRSAIREQLVAALDDWAWVKPAKDAAGRERLNEVARLADPDDWRNRFRDAAMRKDRRALEGLADGGEVASLPPTGVVLLARALGNAGAHDEALQVLRRAVHRHPADFWLNYEAGAAYGRIARSGEADPAALQEAIGFFRTTLACRPDSAPAHSNLAWWLSHQGKQEEAILLCEKAIRLDPNHFPGHFVLGIALNRKGAPADAVAALRRAVELQPRHSWANFDLACAYRQTGDSEKAIEQLRRTIRRAPQMTEPRYELGTIFRAGKRWREASAEFREVLRLKPDHHRARCYLATSLAYQGELDDAVAEAREAVRLRPQEALGHYTLGFALHRKGRAADAVAAYRESIRLGRNTAQVHHELAAALRDNGEFVGAAAEFAEAVRLEPRRPPHRTLMSLAGRRTSPASVIPVNTSPR